MTLLVRPDYLLDTDWAIALLSGTRARSPAPVPINDDVRRAVGRFIGQNGWSKAGPAAYLIVRNEPGIAFVTASCIEWLTRMSTLDCVNLQALRRMMTTRTEWSKK